MMWRGCYISILGINNVLGNNLDFLKALHDKQNLTVFDLSWNSFNDTTQMRDLFQTLPHLEFLDLSQDQLTDGSLLVPALSALQRLKKLNLAGNTFTTADRIAIWNATSSFLPQSPFYLDKDPVYTTFYLESFLPNTTRLDLSRLIFDDPATFKTIMPQVIDLFPDLRELDLSHNLIVTCDSVTNKVQTEGIEALIYVLPQLKRLQFLTLSHGYVFCSSSEATPYYQNFSYTLGQLPSLQTLDLSMTWFLYAKSLGKGLEKSQSLTSVNLDGCWGRETPAGQWQHGIQLIKGLQVHPHLTDLDLSSNPIGSTTDGTSNSNSTLALASALSSWSQLQSLNLEEDAIGYGDRNSASVFLKKLAELATSANKDKRPFQVNLLDGIQNVDWTKGARVLATLTQQKIQDACAAEVCTGKPLNPTSTSPSSLQKHETRRARLSQESHLRKKDKRDRRQERRKERAELRTVTAQAPSSTADISSVEAIAPLTSSSSRLAPFYAGAIETMVSWISPRTWKDSINRAYDSILRKMVDYSRSVVKDCPSYFTTMDPSQPPSKGANAKFRTYPVPHFRAIDQVAPNHTQAAVFPPMVSGYSFLQLPQ